MSKISTLWIIALLGACLGATASPSPQDLYVQAIAAMSDPPQPEYVTYRLESGSDGFQMGLIVQRGQVWLNIQPGSSPQHWTLRHRTFDYATEIVDAGGNRRYVTRRSFFDPTWYGAYRALHEGMLDSQDPAPPRTSIGPPTPTPPPILKTIAVTSVMGPGIYNIEDRGAATCANGDPGHALHLWSRDRDPLHQLSDVIIDMRSMRFCMLRFDVPSAFGFSGLVEQHYANVGGYWMQTDGLLDGNLRALGVSMHHGVWRYRLLDMQFPDSLPPEAFDPRQTMTGL